MLRETNVQRLHWADKTMSMLQRDQLEACEKRLALLPDVSVFGLENELRTEEVWHISYDAQEHPRQTALHTCQGLRSDVLYRLDAEAALLSLEEHQLVERLITLEGTAELIDYEEIAAAESLVRRLWCTISREETGIRVHLPDVLLTPLTMALSSRQHQELREKIIDLDTAVRATLCLHGILSDGPVIRALMRKVLCGSYACDLTLAMRFIRASFDYICTPRGEMLLLHPGLADPERLMASFPPSKEISFSMEDDALRLVVYGMLPQEQPLVDAVLNQIHTCTRPEIHPLNAVDDLRILAKQGVSLRSMQEVLASMLVVQPTREMLLALAQLHDQTPRWGRMCTGLVQ